jgi:RHS repeat-associated protein
MKFLSLLLLYTTCLFSSEILPSFAKSDVYRYVNVISGQLNLNFEDAKVQAGKPLYIRRNYTSSGALERARDGAEEFFGNAGGSDFIGKGWSLFPQLHLFITTKNSWRGHEWTEILAKEPNGTLVRYKYKGKEKKHILSFEATGDYPVIDGQFTAKNKPSNNRLILNFKTGRATIFLPSGGKRIYEGKKWINPQEPLFCYKLKEEIDPSHHVVTYHYHKKDQIQKIILRNPQRTKELAEIRINNKGGQWEIICSDGNQLNYDFLRFEKHFYLNKMSKNGRGLEKFGYHPGRKKMAARIQEVALYSSNSIQVAYYMPSPGREERRLCIHPDERKIYHDKVEHISMPALGQSAFFIYEENRTIVEDEKGRIIHYYHDGEKLQSIETYDSHQNLHGIERYYWQDDNLICRAFFDPEGGALLAKTFSYDDKGNVVKEKVWGSITGKGDLLYIDDNGNILSGEGYGKYYQYEPHCNQLIHQSEDNGMSIEYRYIADTNLLVRKYTLHYGKRVLREFKFYDDDHFVICEIKDDGTDEEPDSLNGVTQRNIKRITRREDGLSKTVVDSYVDLSSGKEITLQTTKYIYNGKKQVCRQEIYDSNGDFLHDVEYQYDEDGQIVYQTDLLGRVSRAAFDDQKRLVHQYSEKKGQVKSYSYDNIGRIAKVATLYGGEILEEESHDYSDSNTICHINPKGHLSKEYFDDFDRPSVTEMVAVAGDKGKLHTPSLTYAYDPMGNIKKVKVGKTVNTTHYNIFGDPLEIIHADGSAHLYYYHTDGSLAAVYYPDGSSQQMTYDPFKRIISKRLIDTNGLCLEEERWVYNAFHLLEYQEANGLTKQYQYDGAGRKIAEVDRHNTITYHYDAKGQLQKVYNSGNHTAQITFRDQAGRVIESWEECEGKKEKHKLFSYNAQDKLLCCDSTDGKDLFTYDAKGRLLSHIDPLGHETQTIYIDDWKNQYGQKVLVKKETDPQGHRKEWEHDTLGHVVSVKKYSSDNKLLSQEDYFYDDLGNQVRRESGVFEKGQWVKKIDAEWEYDSRGRVIKEKEAGAKVTQYQYDLKGRKIATIKPDGITIYYQYDAKDRVTEKKSSDGSIHYRYQYGTLSEPTRIDDLVNQIHLERKYDDRGLLTFEKNHKGQTYHWEYDSCGRCVTFTLPDGSKIRNRYQGKHLVFVERESPLWNYSHQYEQFDDNGHVILEKTIYGQKIATSHDKLQRPIQQEHHDGAVTSDYNELGLLTDKRIFFQEDKKYQYDPLRQIVQENQKQYHFDSIGNPYGDNVQVNDLNQIEKKEEWEYSYDLNGNLISKSNEDRQITYHYDALDRLIGIEQGNRKVTYTYDGLDRLIEKTTHTNIWRVWTQEETVIFIYDKKYEIGCFKDEFIYQLKVLGLGYTGEIGAAVALEIDGLLYEPIHDLKGNIIAIRIGKEITEQYDMDAFGFQDNNEGVNPWRFSSKRLDEDLIYFGARFYDPKLERWLTPDPAGFTDGPNLYHYSLNDPVNRLDLFGLFSRESNTQVLKPIEPFLFNTVIVYPPNYSSDIDKMTGKVMIIGDETVFFDFSLETLEKSRNTLIHSISQQISEKIPLINILINGIQVGWEEFQEHCENVHKELNFPVIGLHNPTWGFWGDFGRERNERIRVETKTVQRFTHMLSATVETLVKINPNFVQHCIAHSEGGLIFSRAFEKMTEDQQKLLKKNLLVTGLGPAEAIPNLFGKEVFNFWSDRDYITKPDKFTFEKLSQNQNYNVELVKCKATVNDKTLWYADHNFMSPTYQDVRKTMTYYYFKFKER